MKIQPLSTAPGAPDKSVAHFNPEEREEDERIYREAILRFVEEKRLEDILGQGEIASLQGYARFCTLMKGKLVNTVRVCRRAPRADCRLAVLEIIHFCADNADGLCRLPVVRFAQILSRDARNIQRAIDDLEENHEIGVHRSAAGNSYWPIIDRVVRDTSPALGWFIDTFSDKPAPVGRPRKNLTALTPYHLLEKVLLSKMIRRRRQNSTAQTPYIGN